MPNGLETGQKGQQHCWSHLRPRYDGYVPRWLDSRSRRLQSSQRRDGLPNRLETHRQVYEHCWRDLRSRFLCDLPRWLDPRHWRLQSS